jgi:hypothetical protein
MEPTGVLCPRSIMTGLSEVIGFTTSGSEAKSSKTGRLQECILPADSPGQQTRGTVVTPLGAQYPPQECIGNSASKTLHLCTAPTITSTLV